MVKTTLVAKNASLPKSCYFGVLVCLPKHSNAETGRRPSCHEECSHGGVIAALWRQSQAKGLQGGDGCWTTQQPECKTTRKKNITHKQNNTRFVRSSSVWSRFQSGWNWDRHSSNRSMKNETVSSLSCSRLTSLHGSKRTVRATVGSRGETEGSSRQSVVVGEANWCKFWRYVI